MVAIGRFAGCRMTFSRSVAPVIAPDGRVTWMSVSRPGAVIFTVPPRAAVILSRFWCPPAGRSLSSISGSAGSTTTEMAGGAGSAAPDWAIATARR